MEGRGLFDSSTRKFTEKIQDRINRAISSFGGQSTQTARAPQNSDLLLDTFEVLGFFPATIEFLKKVGYEDIDSLVVRRAPIAKGLEFAFNTITAGNWERAKSEIGYDSMFHLSLIVNGRYAIQRLSRISVAPKDADHPQAEFMQVPLPQHGEALTIKELLKNTLTSIGREKFYKYDAFTNNCQNFVVDILGANRLLTPQLHAFILQPVDELISKQPGYTSRFARTLTDIGHLVGAGKHGIPGMHHAFTEDDIRKLTGNIPILRYPELAEMASTDDLFKGHPGAALLFLTKGPSEGHWIAVLDKPDHHEVFDSYGTKIDGDRAWLDQHKLMEFHETLPLLSKLLRGSGKRVVHNTKKLQADHADTCGRYVAARIVKADTPLHEFVHELTSNGRTPDENVTLMTEAMKR